MKYLLPLIIFFGIQSTYAHADNLLETFGNIFSFGETGRKRDQLNAEFNLRMELQKQLEAERIRAKKIESLLEKNAIIGADLKANEQILIGLDLLTELMNSQKTFMLQVFAILLESNQEMEIFRKLVVLQQLQFFEFIKLYKKGDPNNKGILSAEQMLLNFTQQLSDFPVEELDKSIVGEMISESMNNMNILIEVLDETKTLVKQRISHQKSEIAEINRRKEALKKKSKPKIVYRNNSGTCTGCYQK